LYFFLYLLCNYPLILTRLINFFLQCDILYSNLMLVTINTPNVQAPFGVSLLHHLLFIQSYYQLHPLLFIQSYNQLHPLLFIQSYYQLHPLLFIQGYDQLHPLLFIQSYNQLHPLLFIQCYDQLHPLLFIQSYNQLHPLLFIQGYNQNVLEFLSFPLLLHGTRIILNSTKETIPIKIYIF
jgi:hypothetical protein